MLVLGPLGCGPGSEPGSGGGAQLFALSFPDMPAEATIDGKGVPLLQRTLRYGAQGEQRVLFSEAVEVSPVGTDKPLAMDFTTLEPFSSVGALIWTDGDTRSVAMLTLKDEHGRTIASTVFSRFPDHSWLDLRFDVQNPGSYRLEMTRKSEALLGWWGKRIAVLTATREKIEASSLPFAIENPPQYTGRTVEIPAGFRAQRLLFLGGLSSYDHGVGWWGDYEAQRDSGDRQFIGDQAGTLQVVYDDGSADNIPLVFGWNLWWYTDYDSTANGGPHPEPFQSDPQAAAILRRALVLQDGVPDPLARYFWVFQPRNQTIKTIHLIDNPEKQGFPVISAITVLTNNPSSNLRPLAGEHLAAVSSVDRLPVVTAADATQKRFAANLQSLRQILYTSPAVVQKDGSRLQPAPSDRLVFRGDAAANILTRVYAENVPDLLSKFGEQGKFHTSSQGSTNWGGYQGIGTWRDGRGLFYEQSWSRDMGRSVLEATRLGFLDQAIEALHFADSHLYDLPNAFPNVNRDGQKVPAHWATIVDDPMYLDADNRHDGNQENDGHGLLLLAHYAVWQAKGRDPAWLNDRWPIIRDAADWYRFQMDNPSFSRAKDVLFTEGESANGQGYDVYSNFIAMKALEKAAEMAEMMGEVRQAWQWQALARRLRDGMLRSLTVSDPKFGATWKVTALDWTYGHESLAPLLIGADTDGFELDQTDAVLDQVTHNTYLRQLSQPSGVFSPRSLGYGQSFITQAALLEDDVENYTKALEALASYIYYPGHEPFLVPEGVAVHPSGDYWYRTGDLGNAVHQAEVLKTLAIVAGVDSHSLDVVKLLPRLPLGWTGIDVKDFPLTVTASSLSYHLERGSRYVGMDITASKPIASLSVRLGPIPKDAGKVTVEMDCPPASTSEITIGNWRWVWVSDLKDISTATVRVVW